MPPLIYRNFYPIKYWHTSNIKIYHCSIYKSIFANSSKFFFFSIQFKFFFFCKKDVRYISVDKKTLFTRSSSKQSTFTGLSRLIIEKIARYLANVYACNMCTHRNSWYTFKSVYRYAAYTNIDLSIEASSDHFSFSFLLFFCQTRYDSIRLYCLHDASIMRDIGYTKWNRQY